jgi:hypothetical protein
MKMITVLFLSLALGFLSSCAHSHKCACSEKSSSACTSCKDTGAKSEGCTCNKK